MSNINLDSSVVGAVGALTCTPDTLFNRDHDITSVIISCNHVSPKRTNGLYHITEMFPMVLVLPLLSLITVEVVYRPHENGQHFSKKNHDPLDESGHQEHHSFRVFVALNDIEEIVDCVVDGCRFKRLGSADPCHLIPRCTQPRRGLLNSYLHELKPGRAISGLVHDPVNFLPTVCTSHTPFNNGVRLAFHTLRSSWLFALSSPQ